MEQQLGFWFGGSTIDRPTTPQTTLLGQPRAQQFGATSSEALMEAMGLFQSSFSSTGASLSVTDNGIFMASQTPQTSMPPTDFASLLLGSSAGLSDPTASASAPAGDITTLLTSLSGPAPAEGSTLPIPDFLASATLPGPANDQQTSASQTLAQILSAPALSKEQGKFLNNTTDRSVAEATNALISNPVLLTEMAIQGNTSIEAAITGSGQSALTNASAGETFFNSITEAKLAEQEALSGLEGILSGKTPEEPAAPAAPSAPAAPGADAPKAEAPAAPAADTPRAEASGRAEKPAATDDPQRARFGGRPTGGNR